MKIHQFIKIGSNHKNFCEDYIFTQKLNESFILAGVFDGCSSGKDSHFASSLIAKIIKAEANKIAVQEIDKMLIYKLLFKSLKKLKEIKEELHLDENEILSTIILLLLDTKTKQGQIIALGDGFFSVNGQSTEIDQDNTPQYPAYFLNEYENFDDFNKIIDEMSKYKEFSDIKDITISTDGIFSFASFQANENTPDISDFLAKDTKMAENNAMFGRKINILKTKYSMINNDDLGIIRIIFD